MIKAKGGVAYRGRFIVACTESFMNRVLLFYFIIKCKVTY